MPLPVSRIGHAFAALGLLIWTIPNRAEAPAKTPSSPAVIAFVNVNVVPLDQERMLSGQTVIIRGERIVSVGPLASQRVPKGALVIDGRGQYLMPGLVDAHAHIDPTVDPIPNFGFGPLYLAFGITTLFNERGSGLELFLRKGVLNGEIVGPNIYTSGEFVNEPRVNTPGEVEREITKQVREGYDFIKFHEIIESDGSYSTLHGLDRVTYASMNETARRLGIPLVGHGPVNLGLDALLEERQSLSHASLLWKLYFLPTARGQSFSRLVTMGMAGLLVLTAGWGIDAAIRRQRRLPRTPAAWFQMCRLTLWLIPIILTELALTALLLPGGFIYGSMPLLAVYALLALAISVMTIGMLVMTVRNWRGSRFFHRMQAVLFLLMAISFTSALVGHGIPILWRSSDAGIRALAQRLHRAGISVQTTLVEFEADYRLSDPGSLEVNKDPAFPYLPPSIQRKWRTASPYPPRGWMMLTPRGVEFTSKVIGALHHEGVPLMAGTDTPGIPLVAPGSSLHRELRLLLASGLTRYQVLRTATVNSATFLGKQELFGTLTPGKRADLLLTEGNPLDDLSVLEHPVGVMVKGRWFPKARLVTLLKPLLTSKL